MRIQADVRLNARRDELEWQCYPKSFLRFSVMPTRAAALGFLQYHTGVGILLRGPSVPGGTVR